MKGPACVFAGLIAFVACMGLAVQFYVLFQANHSLRATIEVMLVYFTITTNALVAVVMTGAAFDVRACTRSFTVAGAAISILLVGIVYHFLLSGLRELSGGSAAADILLHRTTPVLLPLYWSWFLPRGSLRWVDPGLWSLYPIAYLLYALAWGHVEGNYPYHFLDVGHLGWAGVGRNTTAIALAFLCTGYMLVFVDRRLGRRATDLVRL